jgi:cation transport regulator ChaB
MTEEKGLRDDLPFVYQYNLPAPALEVFREVYNETCRQSASRRDAERLARQRAIAAVKERFVRDRFGMWRRKGEE